MMKRNKRRMFRPNRVVTAGFDVTPGRMQRLRMPTALLVIGLLVSACGGGGGGGGVRSPCPEMEVETIGGCLTETEYNAEVKRIANEVQDSDGFSNQWGLATIKADQAWANLELAKGSNVAPGAEVTVGLIDSGIDLDHPVFAGKTINEELFGDVQNEDGSTRLSHGTAVASVIAASPHEQFDILGVAPGVAIEMIAIETSSGGWEYIPVSLKELGEASIFLEPVLYKILDKNISILNLSIGIPGNIEHYSEDDLRSNFSHAITALEQKETDPGDKTILVWAAGNAHGAPCEEGTVNCVESDQTDVLGKPVLNINASSVEVLAGLPVRIKELQDHSIAVVAVDQNGKIADFSNRCGIAADWCIAAPGVNVQVAFFGPNAGQSGVRAVYGLSGTSFAAPMVSGGLALMKQLFRNQIDLVKRLFDTANKNGKYGKKPKIYGQGLMDLGAATSPQGATMVASGNTVGGAGISLQLTNLRLGGALGDGLRRSLAGQEIAAFDSLGAPFWFKLSGFTGAARGPSSLMRLGELMEQTPIMQRTAGRLTTFTPGRAGGAVEQDLGYARLRFGLVETPTGVENGHFGLARNATTLTLTGHNGMTATAFTTSGFTGRAPASGASLSWRPFDAPLGFRAGWLAEQETLLGTAAAGAFGRLSADAMFAGLETGFAVGQWQLSADAELGTAVPRLQGGILSRMSSLTTSAFALHASRRLANGGSVRISFSQPLRVEGGRAALSVPIGRTKAGDVLRSSLAADLTPSGRQFDVSAQWLHPLADGGDLRFDATWMRNPGHNANAQPAVRLLAGLQFEF